MQKEFTNPQAEYGYSAEKHIAALFALDYPEYVLTTAKDAVYKNDFMLASLDGKLIEKSTGRFGGLEIKTAELYKKHDFDKWNNRIPDNYYAQILHYFLITDWDFFVVCARIKSKCVDGKIISTTYTYFYERKDLKDDLDYLLKKETEFWKCVTENRRPNLILPSLERKIIE